jgi:intracellular sulfur oxidation DsrE/DsrF family protein
MRITKYSLQFLLLVSCCFACAPYPPERVEQAKEPAESKPSLINTSHLDHLFTTIKVKDQEVGAIWIYSEAPDYHLVTDEDEGFTCVDDVARSLVFYCRYYAQAPSAEVRERITALTAFILRLRAENGYFYNFVFPDGTINTTHQNSVATPNWWSWRAFWALTELQSVKAPELKDLQDRSLAVIEAMIPLISTLCTQSEEMYTLEGLSLPRCLSEMGTDQIAIILHGLNNHYRQSPSEDLRVLIRKMGNLMLSAQVGNEEQAPHGAFLSWQNHWHAWGNTQAYALLTAGELLEEASFVEAGLREVRVFQPYFLTQDGLHAFEVQQKDARLEMTNVQQFPQIAYNIRPMVYAALKAYELTGEEAYALQAAELAAWFLGDNPAKMNIYDAASGRTFDGINSADQVNQNSGAESTIEALLTLLAVEQVPVAQAALLAAAKPE